MLFPALVSIFHAKKLLSKIVHLIAVGLIIVLIPTEMLFLFLVWLMGFGCHLIVSNQIFATAFSRYFARPTFLLTFVCALQTTHSLKMPGGFSDIMLGFFFSLLLISIEFNPPNFKWANRPLILLSDMSYTLYLVHFPILTLIVTAVLNNPQLERTTYNITLSLGIALLIFASTYLMYYLFERNTGKVRRYFNALIINRKNTKLQF
jgi:peptidoglycan/LPS O-acetylase OafA/YrhL